MKYHVICWLVFLLSCSKPIYHFKNEKYRLYTDFPTKKNVTVYALDLSGENGEIPKYVYDYDDLVYLNLKNKNIDSLSSSVCELEKLKVLVLDRNINIYIPPCIFEMDNLEAVSLLGCEFSKLPVGFFKMEGLEILNLVSNNFTEDQLSKFKEEMPDVRIISLFD